MKLKFKINLTKSQKQIYEWVEDKTTRIIVWCASRQIGKSLMSEVLLIKYLCKPKSFNAYISPTFANGRKVYKEIKNLLEGKNIIKNANSSTLTIDTIFGSTLQFFSTESPSSIRGNTIKNGICVIDEAAYIPDTLSNGEMPFENVILPILKANWDKNKLLIISTPHGKRGMFYEQYQKAIEGSEGYKSLFTNVYSDELISKEQLELLKANMPPKAWAQEFECQFIEGAVSFFEGFSKCFMDAPFDDTSEKVISIDLSANGEDATVLTIINKRKQVVQYQIDGSLDYKYQKIADDINSLKNVKTVYIETNGVGAVMINEIKKLVTKKHLVKEHITTNTSKLEEASTLSVWFTKGEITVSRDNTELYRQLENFQMSYSPTGKQVLKAQHGGHDDYVLSLMIGIDAYKNVFEKNKYHLSFN